MVKSGLCGEGEGEGAAILTVTLRGDEIVNGTAATSRTSEEGA